MRQFLCRQSAFAPGLVLILALVLGQAFGLTAALGAGAAIEAHGLKITSAWMRATPPGAKVAAGFLEIVNETKLPDRLIGVAAPSIAEKVEMHETIMRGTVAQMRPIVGGLVIPPGGSLTLKPGGIHLMFLGLKGRVTEGERIKARLTFEKAGTVDVEFAVRGIGAGAPQGMHMH